MQTVINADEGDAKATQVKLAELQRAEPSITATLQGKPHYKAGRLLLFLLMLDRLLTAIRLHGCIPGE